MALFCPFCHAEEDRRLDAVDREGNKILLVMFNCPFYRLFMESEVSSESEMQVLLDQWRATEGEQWLESVGPMMKARELRNIERYRLIKQRSD